MRMGVALPDEQLDYSQYLMVPQMYAFREKLLKENVRLSVCELKFEIQTEQIFSTVM